MLSLGEISRTRVLWNCRVICLYGIVFVNDLGDLVKVYLTFAISNWIRKSWHVRHRLLALQIVTIYCTNWLLSITFQILIEKPFNFIHTLAWNALINVCRWLELIVNFGLSHRMDSTNTSVDRAKVFLALLIIVAVVNRCAILIVA